MFIHSVDAVDAVDAICLPFDCEFPESIQIDPPQGTILGRLQVHFGNRISADPSIPVCPKCLQPPRRTWTPLAASRQACDPEIVALGGGKIQKLLRDHPRDCVIAEIRRTCPAVPVSVEARHRTVGKESKRSIED